MMNENVEKLRERAKSILDNNKIIVFSNEKEIMEILNSIANLEDETDLEIKTKTLECIEEYIKVKDKLIIANADYNYFKELAENLRSQKIRIEDTTAFSDPVFKINVKGDEEFVTRKGAEKYMDANSTKYKDIKNNDAQDAEDRRQNNIFEIKSNRNFEIARVLEIIKRYF